MARTSHDFGDTWRNREGTRMDFQQVRTISGGVERVRTRTAVWTSDGSPVVAEMGESEWTIRGKINTAEPTNSPQWAILVVKTAFKKAAAEAPSQRTYFQVRESKADEFYSGMYEQSKSIPEILAHAKGQIGQSAPAASKWLTERARRYAIKYEGYESPSASKSQRRESTPIVEEITAPAPTGWRAQLDAVLPPGGMARNFAIAAGVAAVTLPVLSLVMPKRG